MPISEEVPIPPEPMTADELAIIAALSPSMIQRIDATLLSHARRRWKKVAMLVVLTLEDSEVATLGLPGVFFTQRIRILVEKGELEAVGNLDYMRFSEVRLPAGKEPPG